jgi:tetratricopeptide (TPR) repeat protein
MSKERGFSLITHYSSLITSFMKKENILFAIIGVLLGVIVGYVFATSINRRESAHRAAPASGTIGELTEGAQLPENHPPIPESAGSVQPEGSSADSALIERAQSAPDDFEAQMQAAAVHYRNRRFDEAIELLVRANQLRPDSNEAIVALGNANFDAGRYETAEKWYTAALVKNPKDINVRTDLGLTFLFRQPQDLDRAIREFRRALEIDPRHEQTLQNMVVALTKKGNFKEAATTLDKLAEVSPRNQSLQKLRSEIEAGRASSAK